jgi:hypothetical protein
MNEDEQVFAVTPLGYAVKEPTFGEKIFSGFGLMHRRKPLSDMVIGLKENMWPEWMKASLQAARLAPSAVNRQPWRFIVDEKSITVAVNDKNLKMENSMSKRLDCGIAMLHIEVAALTSGVSGSWEFLDPPAVARFTVE